MPSFRTTADQVRGIIDADDSVDMDPFMETANFLVTDRCVPAGYSDVKLELIERWLSAHFYRVDKDPTLTERQVGSGRWRYEGFKVGESLKLTRAGQQVLLLDDKKTLAHVIPVGIDWLGSTFRQKIEHARQRATESI